MNADNPVGFFGKLPAHGDFIHRNLPTGFIQVWDNWLQGFVSGTREQLGEQWLDIYLTSPVWRFCLSAGVIDNNQWAGVMLPSVDRVGRYFPFSVVKKIPVVTSSIDFISSQMRWYEAVEEICLAALNGQIVIDDLVAEAEQIKWDNSSQYRSTGCQQPVASGVIVEMDSGEQAPSAVLPFMLDRFITSAFSSYSAWSTRGSERIHACAFVAKSLPGLRYTAAMLDGQWQQWNWCWPWQPVPAQ